MEESTIAKAYDEQILKLTGGKAREVYAYLINSELAKNSQIYANIVSIKRLGINDHGMVHMRRVTLYAVTISNLLRSQHINFSAQEEQWADEDDSLVAIIVASFLHDIGMGIHRQRHEFFSVILGSQLIDEILERFYDETESFKRFALKCVIIEAISGHMGTQEVASIEAGVLMVADGCDLEFGRSKPVFKHTKMVRIGDIHRYSSSSVMKVEVLKGEVKPVLIKILLRELAGFFQIEEILMKKILKSPIKDYIEVEAVLNDIHTKYL